MIHSPCTASVASSARAATPAFNNMAEDAKSLVVDRKLDRNSSVIFHLNYSDLFFPPRSSKYWNICNFPQAVLLPFPAHPVLAGRIPCSKISPGTWIHDSKLEPPHCLSGCIFCPLFLPLMQNHLLPSLRPSCIQVLPLSNSAPSGVGHQWCWAAFPRDRSELQKPWREEQSSGPTAVLSWQKLGANLIIPHSYSDYCKQHWKIFLDISIISKWFVFPFAESQPLILQAFLPHRNVFSPEWCVLFDTGILPLVRWNMIVASALKSGCSGETEALDMFVLALTKRAKSLGDDVWHSGAL